MMHEKNFVQEAVFNEAVMARKSAVARWMRAAMPYGIAVAVIAAVFLVSQAAAEALFSSFEHSAEPEITGVFFSIAVICVLSFLGSYLAQGTVFPSFIMAVFLGMAAQQFLVPIIHSRGALGVLVTFGATLILFGGGLETPFANFRKLFWKIIALALPGVLVTALLFSLFVFEAGNAWGFGISVTVAILLGAILASTDPAAIIPLLQTLRFRKRDAKDIVVSESAVNDVVGALLTFLFLGWFAAGSVFSTIGEGYGALANMQSVLSIATQVLIGTLFGIGGYVLLKLFSHIKFKNGNNEEFGADHAFFAFVPIMAFTGAVSLGGSGFLAAFVAGLLFHAMDHLHGIEKFFNHAIDGFFKPVIFLLLGALVQIDQLIAYAPIGIAAACVFMLVIRPLMVYGMLAPFALFGTQRISGKELIFISFVRETGAIPAVLLVTAVSMSIPGTEGLLEIGMWVILTTLLVQPPLTPWVARKLDIAE